MTPCVRTVRFELTRGGPAKVGVAVGGGGVDMTKGIVDYSDLYGEDTKKLIAAHADGKLPKAAGRKVSLLDRRVDVVDPLTMTQHA